MENLIKNDELAIYRGKDFTVSKGITIHQPTLDEICSLGEDTYWSFVYAFTSSPADLKWQLWDSGIDYTEITDFELFYTMIHMMSPIFITSIIFGDLDFRKFEVYESAQSGVKEKILYQKCNKTVNEKVLVEPKNKIYSFLRKIFRCKPRYKNISHEEEYEVIIDEYIYTLIVDVLRKMHGFKRNSKMPANNSTKMVLIEDARDEYNISKTKENHSQLKNLISAMTNSEGFKYSHSEVWDMKINAFMDSVQRIMKTKNADLLLQSGYSGYGINLKDVDKKQLDWIGELD